MLFLEKRCIWSGLRFRGWRGEDAASADIAPRVWGDPTSVPLVSNSLGFLGLWAKRLEHSPLAEGGGVSCQVTEDPDAPRPQ